MTFDLGQLYCHALVVLTWTWPVILVVLFIGYRKKVLLRLIAEVAAMVLVIAFVLQQSVASSDRINVEGHIKDQAQLAALLRDVRRRAALDGTYVGDKVRDGVAYRRYRFQGLLAGEPRRIAELQISVDRDKAWAMMIEAAAPAVGIDSARATAIRRHSSNPYTRASHPAYP